MVWPAIVLGLKYGPAVVAGVFSVWNHLHLRKIAKKQAENGK